MTAAPQTVHVRVNDAATGRPTPCRVRFTGPDGAYYAPFGRLSEFATAWGDDVGGNLLLGSQPWAYIDGTCEVRLPPCPVRVQVAKGFEYTNYVNGMWKYEVSPDLPATGFTDPDSKIIVYDRNTFTKSYIYYPVIMGNAQVALGFINQTNTPVSPSYPPSPTSNAQFQQIMKAIGFAIGAISAHETGHQLSLPYTDCTGSACEYLYQNAESGPNHAWFYEDIPAEHIHWSEEAKCSINNFLLRLPKTTPCK